MYLAPRGDETIGAWYNSLTDLLSDVGFGPAAPPPPATTSGAEVYLEVIRRWSAQVKAEGHVPTRVPATYTFPGQLCARTTGPGTNDPNNPAGLIYVVAPQNIRDADAKVTQAIAADQTGAILSLYKAMGLAPGMDGNNPSSPFAWPFTGTQLAIGAGVAVLALVLFTRRD